MDKYRHRHSQSLKKYHQSKLVLLVVVIGLVLFGWFSHRIRAGTNVKVLVIEYNPILENNGNKNLVEYRGWNRPTDLENQFINDVRTVSGGNLNYVIVNRVVLDQIPVKNDGFSYSDDSYLACLTNSASCHQPDWANYLKILTDQDVCGKVNRGEIDEVWLWGGPYFGYWESIMTGPGAFWTNGGPLTGTNCQRKLNIMGFNYERGVAEMLHDLGHRFEGTMKQVYGSWSMGSETNAWNKFTLLEKDRPGKSSCGTVHFAPNSTADYDWSNHRVVTTSCEDWANYPNFLGTTSQVNCTAWGCDQYGYMKWWLGHVPKKNGTASDGKLANWWLYVADYDSAYNLSASTPTPTSTPITHPTPSPIGNRSTPTPTNTRVQQPSPASSPSLVLRNNPFLGDGEKGAAQVDDNLPSEPKPVRGLAKLWAWVINLWNLWRR